MKPSNIVETLDKARVFDDKPQSDDVTEGAVALGWVERLEPVGRGKYEVFEGGVGVLQVFVLAEVEIGLGAYGLPPTEKKWRLSIYLFFNSINQFRNCGQWCFYSDDSQQSWLE